MHFKQRTIVLLLAVMVLCCTSLANAQRRNQLMPLTNYAARSDSLNMRWDSNYYGYVQTGTNNCFSSAAVLTMLRRSKCWSSGLG